MIQSHDDDACCGAALNAALLAGLLDEADEWTHEECGCVWRARVVGQVKHWRAHPQIEVIQRV